MEYTRESREKLYKKYLDGWGRKHWLISKKTKRLAEQLEQMNEYRADRSFLKEAEQLYHTSGRGNLSEFFKEHYKQLVHAFVDTAYITEFYTILDKQNQFPYTRGINRRTVRSKEYGPFIEASFQLLRDYRTLDFYGGSLEKYIRNELSAELQDVKNNGGYFLQRAKIIQLDNMLAARIDIGDQQMIQLIKEMLLSDNNTAILTTDIIRGIVKSSDAGLHQLLADFLVAARLQEGVRQAVCENADCGTVEAFLKIFDTICDNNLIRFAAVKRAVATWTGLGGYEDPDRVSAKVLEDIRAGVDDVSQAYEFTKSNDSIHIMIGLWSLGFRNVEDAINVMRNYLENGTKNQILTMSYYNRQIENPYFRGIIARELIKRHAVTGEWEYIAAFLPDYLAGMTSAVSALVGQRLNTLVMHPGNYYAVPVTDHFKDEAEAKEHFEILKALYEAMPKKQLEYSPCVFPWYAVSLSKSDLVRGMACIAYMLKDKELNYYVVAQLEHAETGGMLSRGTLIKLMLHDNMEKEATDALIGFLGDRESFTRISAYVLLKKRILQQDQYKALEELLKYKNSDIRKSVLDLLLDQYETELIESVKRLLASPKEEVREGGFSLVLAARKEKLAGKTIVNEVKQLTAANPSAFTEKEWVLIEEITGESRSEEILNKKGYGLYQPEEQLAYPVPDCDTAFLKQYFSVSSKQIASVIEKLKALLEANAQKEYKTGFGETKLLGNCFYTVTYDRNLPLAEQYPFKELWIEFYEKEIKSPDFLNLLTMAVQPRKAGRPAGMLAVEKMLLLDVAEYNKIHIPYNRQHNSDYILTIFQILQSIYGTGQLRRAAMEAAKYILKVLPADSLWYQVEIPESLYRPAYKEKQSLAKDYQMFYLLRTLTDWKTDEEFKESFQLLFELDKAFQFNEVARSGKKRYYSYRSENENFLGIYEYIKAASLSLLSENMLYKAVFETYGLKYSFQEMGRIYKDKMSPYDKLCLKKFVSEAELEQEKLEEATPFLEITDRIYRNTVDCILDVELKRGEFATVFSESIVKIERFFGMERLVQILVSFGKEKLYRSQHYRWRNVEISKQESFSHLIRACYPLPSDNAEGLRELLKKNTVSEQRLIEVAMYAPQWMEIFEEYLGYPGFKTGCYYFMAHMNEQFDDKKTAVIAKYTPLTVEELNQGAFDVNWFEEAYEKLGEKIFRKLYEAAKYSSDGGKHTRARKYADAALGRVTCEDLEREIVEKRNKDLLMSYGLVPFSDRKELVHRYEFIKKYEKDSKQFGAQRRASEAAAAAMALRNLSTKAGYADIMRLSLAMETELVKTYAAYFEWQQVGEVQIKIAVDELGQAELLCEKNGKTLKSIPSALKKEEMVLAVREVHKKLKEQYSRTVKMFEAAMETYEIFLAEELQKLCENPVTAAIVRALVFVTASGETMGFFDNAVFENKESVALRDAKGEKVAIGLQDELRVAHPFDMYRASAWSDYQEYFQRMAQEGKAHKQPFRQVFRELYVKLPEELDMFKSRMFAGNQIQPSKTVACLKNRKWVADYEDGLQKVYYKQNIIARIYALADWFSPSDIEAPTLEWVEFSDRKTFQSIAIKDVPDVIYSEVMRDVDLAVSVAHAGGVDPETSHSTIEMRKVIVAFNLKLFALNNVTVEGTHALIQGKLGSYSVHLGSGVIHQMGGHQVNVLPVHSQSRGKLFLPFIDEDPKTAEIMSKIVLFAKDEKIKDPYILQQIVLDVRCNGGN